MFLFFVGKKGQISHPSPYKYIQIIHLLILC
nr:MAG TPA: hypothetical protein [Caudoviricetes sp.]